MIVPVILSGGSGKRLWPLSRTLFPKQFINLINDTTLFQDTILRLPEDISDPLIICNEEHRFLVAEQLRQIESNNSGIILEPIGKNTAPAIALAALNLSNSNQDQLHPYMNGVLLSEDNGLSTNTPTEETWGGKQTPPADVFYYQYERMYPHHGTGNWVLF